MMKATQGYLHSIGIEPHEKQRFEAKPRFEHKHEKQRFEAKPRFEHKARPPSPMKNLRNLAPFQRYVFRPPTMTPKK